MTEHKKPRRKMPSNREDESASVEDIFDAKTNQIRPLERSFETITWTSPTMYENLCRIMTHMDPGSSLIHACLNAICIPYRDGQMYNQEISQIEFAHIFRKELAFSLDEIDETTGKRYIELLGHGSWVAMLSTDSEVLAKQLETPTCELDPVMIEHLSNVINKDIFIIDAETEDILLDSREVTTRYKNRKAIVVLNVKGHYELLCLRQFSGEFITHFDPSHPWITQLRDIILSKIQ